MNIIIDLVQKSYPLLFSIIHHHLIHYLLSSFSCSSAGSTEKPF